jgi:hypothetical protein
VFTSETKVADITSATTNGTEITYTANNTFTVGDIVHISGVSKTEYNLPDAEVSFANSTTFKVANAEVLASVGTGDGGRAVYDELKNHTITTSVININSLTLAEINLNAAQNISNIGNYRYRPNILDPTESNYGVVRSVWAEETDSSISKYYYGATDVDVVVDAGFDDDDEPYVFVDKNKKTAMLMSLEDCFGRYRPRSGINKVMNIRGRYFNYSNEDTSSRPRYYAASPTDKFKYWCSYRQEYDSVAAETNVVGLSQQVDSVYMIDDVAPFVVYKEDVPANRIIVKMQTHVGSVGSEFNDPFFGDENKSTPLKWKIQTLNGNDWTDSWTDCWTTPADVVPVDGYVELEYGLVIPEDYADVFLFAGDYPSVEFLPAVSVQGYAYLVGASTTASGDIYVWDDNEGLSGEYVDTGAATYAWRLGSQGIDSRTPFANNLVDPEFFVDDSGSSSDRPRTYREFDFIRGLRIVVETMNRANATFDLIELSPRLSINLSDKVSQFSITKQAADLGNAALPVGQLLSSTGKLELFDYDQAFNTSQTFVETEETVGDQTVYGSTGSIIYNFVPKNLQVKFYEVIKDIGPYNYYVPIKTLFCEGFPQTNIKSRSASLELRDQFTQFESFIAPELFIPSVSLSVAVAMLLDSIGFSNYIFKRIDGVSDPIIPFFFVAPNKSVAEVLQDLAVSTQHAMFFDEYNNLVVMSKEYIMPTESERSTDFVLYGSKDYTQTTGEAPKVKVNNKKLSNIIEVATETREIYNDGKITFSERSIQKSIATVQEAYGVDKARRYIYKPVLLWEAQPSEKTKTINGESGDQNAMALAATPLSADISALPPASISVAITNAVQSDTINTYTTNVAHGFVAGEFVTITGVSPEIFNVADRKILTIVNSTSFTIASKNTYNVTAVANTEDATTRYTCKNNLKKGDSVKISGLLPIGYNRTSATILNSNPDYFDIATTVTTTVTDSVGVVQKLPNTFTGAGSARVVRDDTIDLGGGAYFLPRYDGYLYANGEIIRYRGIEFSIQGYGKVWISNNEDYQYYFSKLRFGKKIFPTGRIRVYSKFNDDGNVIKHGRGQFGTDIVAHSAQMSTHWSNKNNIRGFVMQSQYIFTKKTIPATEIGSAGTTSGSNNNTLIARAGCVVSNKIKNVLVTNIPNEDTTAKATTYANAGGSVQASALVFKGVPSKTLKEKNIKPRDFVSYIPKTLDKSYVHFGTRMRIIGNVKSNQSAVDQVIDGSTEYYKSADNDSKLRIDGGGGGIAFLLDSTSAVNTGYFFEISALSYSGDATNPDDAVGGNNIFLYKVKKETSSSKAIPVNMWQGFSQIIVDDGEFVGQQRQVALDYVTVYDLAVEYHDISKKLRRIYLYINDTLIAIVDDTDPLQVGSKRNQVAPFVRGSSKIMFENLYAMKKNYAYNPSANVEPPGREINPFQDANLSTDTALHKYALSGIIKDTMLSGIGPSSGPKYSIYFEEFGTIMRECMYFDVKFDKAYPSLSSKLSPTMNSSKGFVVSSFISNAYGAQFMVFNATDNILTLDSDTGNYLRIQGVTFNQESQNILTVDSYYDRVSDFSSTEFESVQEETQQSKIRYIDIKNSRSSYGTKEFNLSATYIQDRDAADNIMGWVLSKTVNPRKSVGLKVFGLPYVQMGDIVTIDYTDKEGVDQISTPNSRYVVYSMEYNYGTEGPETIIYLSEVV